MADRAQGAVSFTPIVTFVADSDADAVDAIHHDIGGSLGGVLKYTFGDNGGTDRWFYDASKELSSSADLISGNFTDAATAITTSDKVCFLSLTHLGIDDTGATTTAALEMVFDGGVSNTQTDGIIVYTGESCVLKFSNNGPTVGDLHASSANGTDKVMVKIAAIITDV